MSRKSLKTRSLLELIDLFERCSNAVACSAGQRLHGVAGWDLARQSALSASDLAAWTERIGYAGSYPTPCDDEHIPVEIHEDEDPDRYRYRCPQTFRTKYVAADLVAVYAIPAVKLLTLLADLLGIAQAHRRGISTPAIDGVLWNLGKMRIGNVQVDVWLARGLASCIERVFAYFEGASLPGQGLIFTTGQSLPGIVPPPRSYRVVTIAEVLVDYTVTPHIDTDLIHRVLLAPTGKRGKITSGSLRSIHKHADHRNQDRQALVYQRPQADQGREVSGGAVRERPHSCFRRRHFGRCTRFERGGKGQAGCEHF